MSRWCQGDFETDSLHERGRILTGIFAHYCNAWDGLTMDETCYEFPCECYRDEVHWVQQAWPWEAGP